MVSLNQDSTYGQNAINISYNTFRNNFVSNGDLISIKLAKYSGDQTAPYIVKWNLFEYNTVTPALSYYIYTNYIFGAILHVKTEVDVDVRYNIFDNPETNYQLAVSDTGQDHSIDARLCFWGSSDIKDIDETVFVQENINLLGFVMLLYHPYLNSRDTTDIDESKPRFPPFRVGNQVGGVVFGSENLTSEILPYEVVSDIIIPSGSTLTVHAGVEMQFRLGVSIQVFGTLNFEGEPNERIMLTAFQSPVLKAVRLVNGTDPWIGFVELLVDGLWLPTCYVSYGVQVENQLCYSSGYQTRRNARSSGLPYNPNSNQTITSVTCSENNSGCTVDSVGLCQSDRYLYLECLPNYWSGIHFTAHANPSRIAHVDMYYAGSTMNEKTSYAAIEMDFHSHYLYDIVMTEFPSSNSKGILVQIANAYVQNLDGIVINIKSGTGIYSYDRRLVVQNSTVQSASNGVRVSSSNMNVPLNLSLVMDICDANASYQLDGQKDLFIHITDRSSQNYQRSCDSYIQSKTGEPILVQIIKLSYYSSCHKDNFVLYKGHMNHGDVQNITFDYNLKDGVVFVNGLDGVHLVFSDQQKYYYHDCIDVVILVTTANTPDSKYF